MQSLDSGIVKLDIMYQDTGGIKTLGILVINILFEMSQCASQLMVNSTNGI